MKRRASSELIQSEQYQEWENPPRGDNVTSAIMKRRISSDLRSQSERVPDELEQCISSIGIQLDIPAYRLEAWIENIVQVLKQSNIFSVGNLVAAALDGTKWRVDGVSTVFWCVAESQSVLRDAGADAKSNDVSLSSEHEKQDNLSTNPDEKERYA